MNDELEDLKQCMAEQGLTVDVKRETDGQIRVDVMSDTNANSEADRSGRATAPSLRDRIACVLAGITPNNTPKPQYVEMADEVMVEVKKELANEYNKGYGDGHEEGWREGWDANE